MNNDNLIFQSIFPKSNNHKITWTKKDSIKTCDLNPNCSEIFFDINKKIINDIPTLIDTLPTGNPPIYETFITNNFISNIISLILVVILLIIFFLINRK